MARTSDWNHNIPALMRCRWRRSGADEAPRCASLLFPSLGIHADHEEPQGRRSFPEEAREAGDHIVTRQTVCENYWNSDL
jgi:hypothetical protein